MWSWLLVAPIIVTLFWGWQAGLIALALATVVGWSLVLLMRMWG
jgi:hypothetical protein